MGANDNRIISNNKPLSIAKDKTPILHINDAIFEIVPVKGNNTEHPTIVSGKRYYVKNAKGNISLLRLLSQHGAVLPSKLRRKLNRSVNISNGPSPSMTTRVVGRFLLTTASSLMKRGASTRTPISQNGTLLS